MVSKVLTAGGDRHRLAGRGPPSSGLAAAHPRARRRPDAEPRQEPRHGRQMLDDRYPFNRNFRRQRATARLDVNRDNGAPKSSDKKFSNQPS